MRWQPVVSLMMVIGSTRASAQSPAAAPIVIYLHGRIIEEQGPTAVSPEFGAYRYHAILDSLRAGGFLVLADVRPKGTDATQYAERVAGQVDSLLQAGISPARIAVVGFSKGGGIAILAAAQLRRTDVTFVFLAACTEGNADRVIAGRVLSVFEESDRLGRSCEALVARALPGTVSAERQISTELKHGAFYQPRPEWLEPVRAWIRRSAP